MFIFLQDNIFLVSVCISKSMQHKKIPFCDFYWFELGIHFYTLVSRLIKLHRDMATKERAQIMQKPKKKGMQFIQKCHVLLHFEFYTPKCLKEGDVFHERDKMAFDWHY